jgi:hypothetical protein
MWTLLVTVPRHARDFTGIGRGLCWEARLWISHKINALTKVIPWTLLVLKQVLSTNNSIN